MPLTHHIVILVYNVFMTDKPIRDNLRAWRHPRPKTGGIWPLLLFLFRSFKNSNNSINNDVEDQLTIMLYW